MGDMGAIWISVGTASVEINELKRIVEGIRLEGISDWALEHRGQVVGWVRDGQKCPVRVYLEYILQKHTMPSDGHLVDNGRSVRSSDGSIVAVYNTGVEVDHVVGTMPDGERKYSVLDIPWKDKRIYKLIKELDAMGDGPLSFGIPVSGNQVRTLATKIAIESAS